MNKSSAFENNETDPGDPLTAPNLQVEQHIDTVNEIPPTLTQASVFDYLEKKIKGIERIKTSDTPNEIDFILDIPVQLTVELGRTRMEIKNLLKLSQGAVIELNAAVGQPMDVLVNGCIVAQGEIVMVSEKYGIRLTDVVTPAERIRKLNRA